MVQGPRLAPDLTSSDFLGLLASGCIESVAWQRCFQESSRLDLFPTDRGMSRRDPLSLPRLINPQEQKARLQPNRSLLVIILSLLIDLYDFLRVSPASFRFFCQEVPLGIQKIKCVLTGLKLPNPAGHFNFLSPLIDWCSV